MRHVYRMGAAPVVVTISGRAVPGNATGPLKITRGRDGADGRPEAATLSVQLRTDLLPVAPELGATVTVNATDQALAYFGAPESARARFVGRVTDLKANPASRELTSPVLELVAVGPRSRLAGLYVGDTPWPAELDGARAARVLALVMAIMRSISVGLVDPGTATVLARDVDRQPALSLLEDLSADTGGELVELRDGTLTYRDANARTNAPVAVELAADNIVAPSAWQQSLDGMVNRLHLTFGAEDAGLYVDAVDQPAVDAYDAIDAELRTQLTTGAAATLRAFDLVGRRSRPRWRIDTLAVDLVDTLNVEQAAALLAADYGAQLRLYGLPTSGPRVSANVFLEGATETITARSWGLELAVSDRTLTAAATRWADLPGKLDASHLPTAAPIPDPVHTAAWMLTPPADFTSGGTTPPTVAAVTMAGGLVTQAARFVLGTSQTARLVKVLTSPLGIAYARVYAVLRSTPTNNAYLYQLTGAGVLRVGVRVTTARQLNVVLNGVNAKTSNTVLAIDGEYRTEVDVSAAAVVVRLYAAQDTTPLEVLTVGGIGAGASIDQLVLGVLLGATSPSSFDLGGVEVRDDHAPGPLAARAVTPTARWRTWDWRTRTWTYTTAAISDGPAWADVDPTLSWLTAVVLDYPDTTTDRWLDQPADVRWQQLDPAPAWSTY